MAEFSLAATLVEPSSGRSAIRSIARTLTAFGEGAVAFAAGRKVSIVALRGTRTYREASPALRRLGVDIDAWPVPPAGLFVCEERTVYLRSLTPMTIAHEFAHALDCALGDGVYLSGCDPSIRTAFARAKAFVTPYAATAIDEYFAESLRAHVGINDPSSPWPRVSPERLRAVDAMMADLVARIFRERLNA